MLKLYRSLLRLIGFDLRYIAVVCDDLPDKIGEKKLFLVGESGHFWQAAMRCPCGCRDLIQLSLTPNSRPRWTVSGAIDRPTLSPSVDRQLRCRSHYFLKNGAIKWCE